MLNDEGIGRKKIRRMRKSIFGGECPLTERPCEHFDCEHCKNADTGGLKRTPTDLYMC